MAIYYNDVRNISASKGQSCHGAIAYRMGINLNGVVREVREDGTIIEAEKEFNYAQRKGILFKNIYAPVDAPVFVHDAQELTDCIREKEDGRRRNKNDARYWKEIIWALPKEFDLKHNLEAVETFINETLVKQGFVTTVGVHKDDGSDNIHAHITFSSRKIIDKDFSNVKDPWIDSKRFVYHVRKEGAEVINRLAQKYNYNIRVTEKSYKDCGIDLLPKIKEGWGKKVSAKHKDNVEIALANLAIVEQEPKQFLKKMCLEYSEFTDKEVLETLFNLFRDIGEKDEYKGKKFVKKMEELHQKVTAEITFQRENGELFYRVEKGQVFYFKLKSLDEVEANSSSDSEVVDSSSSENLTVTETKVRPQAFNAQVIPAKSLSRTDKTKNTVKNFVGGIVHGHKYNFKKAIEVLAEDPLGHLPSGARIVSGVIGRASAKYEYNGMKFSIKNGSVKIWNSLESVPMIKFFAEVNGYQDQYSYLERELPESENKNFDKRQFEKVVTVQFVEINQEEDFDKKLDKYFNKLVNLSQDLAIEGRNWLELSHSVNYKLLESAEQRNLKEKLANIFEKNQLKEQEVFENEKGFEAIVAYGKQTMKSNLVARQRVERNLEKRGYSAEIIKKMIDEFGYIDDIGKLADYMKEHGISEEQISRHNFKRYQQTSHSMILPFNSRNGLKGIIATEVGRDKRGEDQGRSKNTKNKEFQLPKYINYNMTKKDQGLLGSDNFHPGKPIIVVEGNLDTVSLKAAGIKNVYGLSGSQITPDQLFEIVFLAKNKDTPVLIALDNDSSGKLGTIKAIKQFLSFNIEPKIILTQRGKDLDEVLVKDGVEGIKNEIANVVEIEKFVDNYIAEFADKDLEDKVVFGQFKQALKYINQIYEMKGIEARYNTDIKAKAGLYDEVVERYEAKEEIIESRPVILKESVGNIIVDQAIAGLVGHLVERNGVFAENELRQIVATNLRLVEQKFEQDLKEAVINQSLVGIKINELTDETIYLTKEALSKEQMKNLLKIVNPYLHENANREIVESRIIEAKNNLYVNENVANELYTKWGSKFKKIQKDIIDQITTKSVIWTEEDLQEYLRNNEVVKELKANSKLDIKDITDFALRYAIAAGVVVELKRPELNGTKVYTSKTYLEKEVKCLELAQAVNEFKFKIDKTNLDEFLAKTELNDGQKKAVKHSLSENGIGLVQGLPGTGKTTTLKSLKSYVEQNSEKKIIGVSAFSIVAQSLERDIGIEALTIDKFLVRIERGESFGIKKGDFIVIDEAGVAKTDQVYKILNFAKKVGAKPLFCGDSKQLKAIDNSQIFRKLLTDYESVNLDTIIRQKAIPKHIEAIQNIWASNYEVGIKLFHETGSFKFVKDNLTKLNSVVESYLLDESKSKMIIATKNEEVDELNKRVRTYLKNFGDLNDQKEVKVSVIFTDREGAYRKADKGFTINDRIVFTKPDYKIGVSNGSFGRIKNIDGSKITVVLEDIEKEVSFNHKEFKYFTHGYAVTAHKSQGSTVDSVHYMAGSFIRSDLALVAMSRHKYKLKVTLSEEDFKGLLKMSKNDSKIIDEQKVLSAFIKKMAAEAKVRNSVDFLLGKEELLKADPEFKKFADYYQLQKITTNLQQELNHKSKAGKNVGDKGIYHEYIKIRDIRERLARSIGNNGLKYLGELSLNEQNIFRIDAGILKETNPVKIEEKQLITAYSHETDPVKRRELANSLNQGRVFDKDFYMEEFYNHKISINQFKQDVADFINKKETQKLSFEHHYGKAEISNFFYQNVNNEQRKEFLVEAINLENGLKLYTKAKENIIYGDKIINEYKANIQKYSLIRDKYLQNGKSQQAEEYHGKIDKLKKQLEENYLNDKIRNRFEHYVREFEPKAGRFVQYKSDRNKLQTKIHYVLNNYVENELAAQLFGQEQLDELATVKLSRGILPEVEQNYRNISKEFNNTLAKYVSYKGLVYRKELLEKEGKELDAIEYKGEFPRKTKSFVKEEIKNLERNIAEAKSIEEAVNTKEFKEEFTKYYDAKIKLLKLANFRTLSKYGLIAKYDGHKLDYSFKLVDDQLFKVMAEKYQQGKEIPPKEWEINEVIAKTKTKASLIRENLLLGSEINKEKSFALASFHKVNSSKYSLSGKRQKFNEETFPNLLEKAVNTKDFEQVDKFVERQFLDKRFNLKNLLGVFKQKDIGTESKLLADSLAKLHANLAKKDEIEKSLAKADDQKLNVREKSVDLELERILEKDNFKIEVKRLIKEKFYAKSFIAGQDEITVKDLEKECHDLSKIVQSSANDVLKEQDKLIVGSDPIKEEIALLKAEKLALANRLSLNKKPDDLRKDVLDHLQHIEFYTDQDQHAKTHMENMMFKDALLTGEIINDKEYHKQLECAVEYYTHKISLAKLKGEFTHLVNEEISRESQLFRENLHDTKIKILEHRGFEHLEHENIRNMKASLDTYTPIHSYSHDMKDDHTIKQVEQNQELQKHLGLEKEF